VTFLEEQSRRKEK